MAKWLEFDIKKINLIGLLSQYSFVCLSFAALIVVISILSIILRSGYISDDSLNSLTRGCLIEANVSLFQFTYDIFNRWVTSVGRFYPLAWYVYALYFILNSLFLYKSAIVIFVVLDIVVFSYFIYSVTGSKYLSILAILLTPVFLQMRLYHDPTLGFHLLLQLVLLYFMLSLILLLKYLKTANKLYLVLSLIFYLMDLMTYEISYPFFLVYIFVIYLNYNNKNTSQIVRLSLPFILAACGSLLITILIRVYYKIPFADASSPYALNLNTTAYAYTLAKQIYAAFPMSYYLSNPSNIFAHNLGDLDFLSVEILLIFVLYFGLCIHSAVNLVEEKPSRINHLLIYGILFLVLPAIIISFSPKFQNELTWGIGYLPVYLSYFGLILISSYIVCKLSFKIISIDMNLFRMAALLFALIIVFICALNYSNNLNVIERSNSEWLYPRDIAEMSMKDGIFNYVPDGSILLVDSFHGWDQPAFYLMYSDVKFKLILNSANLAWARLPGTNSGFLSGGLPTGTLVSRSQEACLYNFSDADHVFYFRYDLISKNVGYVILGSIKDLYVSNERLLGVTSRYVYVYVRDSSLINSFSN
jgi:hypothetical protein